MLAPVSMRLSHHAILAAFLAAAVLTPAAQQAPVLPAPAKAPPAAVQAPSLTVDRDPVRSPDGEPAANPAANPAGQIHKQGEGWILRTEVDEVELYCTVLEGNRLVPDLKKDNFEVLEDGVKQNLISFQHTDLPVSIALVVDNSGSRARKRPSVNKSAMDLIEASNPQDEAFVVNFSDEAILDQDFTSDVNKLRAGLTHLESRGGTALHDAVVASADKLAAEAKHPKQVLILITDGDDNASTLSLEQTIHRVQQLSGPVIYTIGLFGGETGQREDREERRTDREARRELEMLSNETGGEAFFPKNIEQVDQIAAEVARDIRNQYTLGYHSTKPSTVPGFRHVDVTAKAKGMGKLNVRTRTGYFPYQPSARKPSGTALK
jgi:VWFA-related protein